MKVTIRDISEKTGLSHATVSRVISGNGYVREDKRAAVELAAMELGYNAAARKKKSVQGKIVLVLMDDITNLFYAEISRGVEATLRSQGYRVLFYGSNGDVRREEEYISFADSSGFFGTIMVTATETASLAELLDNTTMPVVMVNRYLRSRDCDAVCIDNYRGGYLATQYLLKMNHTRIAHLAGPSNSSASCDRNQGYVDALIDSGISFNPSMVYNGNLRREAGSEYAEFFISKKLDYTAVFCANDIMARSFIDRLTALGIRVPQDVSVIAFDETSEAVSGGIRITNVGKPPYDMGVASAQLLLERSASPDADVRKIIFAPQLHEYESVKMIEATAE